MLESKDFTDPLSSQLHLIDFGLSKRYLGTDGNHIMRERIHFFQGSIMTASKYAYTWTQSRRDDIIQILYILIFLLRGRLPWMGEENLSKDELYSHTKKCKE